MAQLQTVNRIFKLAVFCALAVFTLVMFQGSLYLFSNGGEPEGELRAVEIPLGTSTAGIARILEEEGIISSALFFRLYVRIQDMDGTLQAGKYQFHENMRPADVVEKLKEGRIYREQIRFTVPEGLRAEQVANRLAAAGLGDEERFLELMASPGEFSFSFLENIPGEGLEYPLEGYLAPNTYNVFEDASEKEVLGVMLRHFASFYTEEFRDKMENMGLGLHETVTLASIVERETRAAEERPVVAAVFLNRIKINMALQSCATVQYALGEVKEVLLNVDLEINSPYNTYLHRGLPPGPIASPGKASLDAVLNPADVDYLYFVYRNDGTGRHYFAETLAGHNENRRKARENRQ